MAKWSRKLYYSEWNIWYNMKYRCNQNKPGYTDVTVCDAWQDWQQFMNDMGPRPSIKHSIDRIDPYGDYEPKNCRWADKSTQSTNTRDKQDRAEYWYWFNKAKENGIKPNTFQWRVREKGLSYKDAATVKRVKKSLGLKQIR